MENYEVEEDVNRDWQRILPREYVHHGPCLYYEEGDEFTVEHMVSALISFVIGHGCLAIKI